MGKNATGKNATGKYATGKNAIFCRGGKNASAYNITIVT